MNGPVDPTAAEQAGIGGGDDGRHLLAGDVALHELDAGGKGRSHELRFRRGCNATRGCAIDGLRFISRI